ncbi:uncharacterized protein CcaverHIS019_0402180 [Cutaneotrichosporon cavernicola]|uniref:ELYS-like domain-containing protein n=1 Tax=Cutaneotrichosporon cavernicola TaxID=279322 RepID=A0AA48QVK2_9TREE|nr:uncharacterized protein CcaverHIS019_0402180 [Cutaneotrichosporon cavernicola]BEI91398.1 hypothetical protein CcaverHIS019_0402180 [Cutaneotrichosporon cavernicola]BEI99172.1 hypothetical protein CcaverHIS631_0402150 [Cutaneotrichosporon cavernicola]BEJ06948.1 hypothetical protein CcaverHIS641_0402170 [Cutaneotrichosporon cavernicola]
MSADEYALPNTVLRYFDLGSAPYRDAADIVARRKASPDGRLFFDRLLAFAEIDGPALYPPTTPAAFRRLLHAIHSTARIDRLKRDCFLYYLVRDQAVSPTANGTGGMDLDSASEADSESAFVRARCLPRTWRVFMDGYWFLDHGRYADGVAALADPAISELNFVPEVVRTLTAISPPSTALRLVYALLDARDLSSDTERSAALLSKASVSGMSAAFGTLRSLNDAAARANGREAVWCWALGAPRTPAGAGTHTAQPRALRELLHLAMHDEESAHLVRFLAHPPREISPPARSLLHDLVTLRLVHAGKYEETLALDRELASDSAPADRQRRREMVREFIDILPEAQRRILLGEDYKRGALANGTATVNGDIDMASSWEMVDELPPAIPAIEDVAAPAPAVTAPSDVAVETPTRSAAPAPSTPGPAAPQPVRVAQRALGLDTPARNGTASPFGGPPRFASPRPKADSTAPSVSSRHTSPTRSPAPVRLASPPRPSASPFVQPAATPKPARKPKKVIKDDTDDTPLRRSTRNRSQPPEEKVTPPNVRAASRAPSEAPIPEGELAPTPVRPRRTAKKSEKAEAVVETPKPRLRRSVRASSRASTVEPVEEEELEPQIPGAFGETPRTRKATKTEEEPAAKRTRGKAAATPATRKSVRAPSEAPSDVSETPVRRTRRTATSEQGSPTPSVASTAAGSPLKRTTRTRARRGE